MIFHTVTTRPEPTAAGPVSDYAAAVQSEFGKYRVGRDTAYLFGRFVVQFYESHGGGLGMDVWKPVKAKTPDLYYGERISPGRKRYNLGFSTFRVP